MNIRFIGTGSGKTSLNRHHSSLLITSDDHNLLVDCGDGTSLALLKQNVIFNSINSILISHLHADHYAGLASLITQMKLQKRNSSLSIFIHSSLTSYVENYFFHSYLFAERLGFDLNIVPFKTENEIKISDSFLFTSKLNSHLEKYKTNDPSGKLSLTSLSFLFKDKNNSVIYTGDIGSNKDLSLFKEKVDWLIVEVSHIDLKEFPKLLQKSTAQKIILTHIDDDFEKEIKIFLISLQNDQKINIIAAFDGFTLHHNS